MGKDINELWQIKNPMGLLTKILEENGRQAPESRFEENSSSNLFEFFLLNDRLLWATGVSSVLATYVVGVYSNKEFLGKSKGMDWTDLIEARSFQVLAQQSPSPKKWLLAMHYVVGLKQTNNEHLFPLIVYLRTDC